MKSAKCQAVWQVLGLVVAQLYVGDSLAGPLDEPMHPAFVTAGDLLKSCESGQADRCQPYIIGIADEMIDQTLVCLPWAITADDLVGLVAGEMRSNNHLQTGFAASYYVDETLSHRFPCR